MYIELNTFRVMREPLSDVKSALTYITEILAKHSVAGQFKVNDGCITVKLNSDKKLFWSTIKNVIPLKPGDSRIESLGRNYLESERLTEKQFSWIVTCLSKGLTEAGISCDITLCKDENEQNDVDFRVGLLDYIERWQEIKPTSFPQERM
jgi:hypothetical protein